MRMPTSVQKTGSQTDNAFCKMHLFSSDNLLVFHTECALGGISLQVTAFAALLAVSLGVFCDTTLVVACIACCIRLESLTSTRWRWTWCWSWLGGGSWRWRCWCWYRPISDDNIGTAAPNLVSLLAIPSP